MLRTTLLAIGVCLVLGALAGAIAGLFTLVPGILGALLVLGILFERHGYKPVQTEPPGPGWQRTAERFSDPASGRMVTVYFHPVTGERRYVAA